MNTTENNNEIAWTSEKMWGAVGLTHRTEVTIAGARYTFTVDQPRKGQWIARGWRDGDLFYYRDQPSGRTLAGAKAGIERQVGELLIAAEADKAAADLAETREAWDDATEDEPECWCEWVDIGVGMQRAAEILDCPEHQPYPDGPPEGWTDPEYVPGRPTIDLSLPEIECLCASEMYGDGTFRVYETPGCPEHDQDQAVTAVDGAAELMRKLMAMARSGLIPPICDCPTPTHRMSCGVGATPKVVSR